MCFCFTSKPIRQDRKAPLIGWSTLNNTRPRPYSALNCCPAKAKLTFHCETQISTSGWFHKASIGRGGRGNSMWACGNSWLIAIPHTAVINGQCGTLIWSQNNRICSMGVQFRAVVLGARRWWSEKPTAPVFSLAQPNLWLFANTNITICPRKSAQLSQLSPLNCFIGKPFLILPVLIYYWYILIYLFILFLYWFYTPHCLLFKMFHDFHISWLVCSILLP